MPTVVAVFVCVRLCSLCADPGLALCACVCSVRGPHRANLREDAPGEVQLGDGGAAGLEIRVVCVAFVFMFALRGLFLIASGAIFTTENTSVLCRLSAGSTTARGSSAWAVSTARRKEIQAPSSTAEGEQRSFLRPQHQHKHRNLLPGILVQTRRQSVEEHPRFDHGFRRSCNSVRSARYARREPRKQQLVMCVCAWLVTFLPACVAAGILPEERDQEAPAQVSLAEQPGGPVHCFAAAACVAVQSVSWVHNACETHIH